MHAAMQYGPGRAQIKMAALASAPRNALIELFSVWSELRIGARAASEACARMSDVGIGPEIQVHVDKQFPVGTLKCHGKSALGMDNTLRKTEKCNPCVRYGMSPMSRAAQAYF
jgi:hypothetical protein